jgi:hypothetical protein
VRQADVTQITMQLGYQCCQRLIASGMLPGRDGQPLQLTVHVDLAELRGQPAAAGLEQGWSTARAAAAGIPGSVYVTGPEAAAAACDAALTPIVTGHIDWAVLDHLTSLYLDTAGHRKGPYSGGDGTLPELTGQTRERLQHTLLQWSIDLLSGPAGTRNAGSPAASSPPRSARSTTSSPGPRAAPPPWATWHFSAGYAEFLSGVLKINYAVLAGQSHHGRICDGKAVAPASPMTGWRRWPRGRTKDGLC